MKRIIFLLTIIFTLSACGTYRYTDQIDQLNAGMTKAEVAYILGRPERVLEVNYTRQGIQEILEYRDYYGDFYALEFWDNYLVNYQYLNNNTYYYIAPTRPAYIPPRGRPVIIVGDRPSRPNRPNNNRPNNRPESSRPNNNNNNSSRPTTTRPGTSTRPTESTRPDNSSNTTTRPSTRPSTNTESDRNSSTRPTGNGRTTTTERTSSNSDRSSTRTSTTSRSSSSSSENQSTNTQRTPTSGRSSSGR